MGRVDHNPFITTLSRAKVFTVFIIQCQELQMKQNTFQEWFVDLMTTVTKYDV